MVKQQNPKTTSQKFQRLKNYRSYAADLWTLGFVKDGLMQWISLINQRVQNNGGRYTYLPFKLHQFISQTGSVYTTLDRDDNRYITLEPGVYKQDEEDKKPIFPNVFSRASGHAFICVSRNGNRLEPREFRESSEDEDSETTDGYLIIGEDIWDPEDDLESLPDAWLVKSRRGPDSKKKHFFPKKLYFVNADINPQLFAAG